MQNVLLSPIRLNELETLISKCVKKGIQESQSVGQKLAYSKKEFAKAIGKSESFVDQERRAGRLEWKRNGGTVSIPATELQKYI